MDTPNINENNGSGIADRRFGPDGEAGFLLAESLLHGLIAKGVLSVADAVEIVEIAAEVKSEFAGEPGAASAAAQASITRLKAIAASLRYDLPPK